MLALQVHEGHLAVGRELNLVGVRGKRARGDAGYLQLKATIITIEPDRTESLVSCQINPLGVTACEVGTAAALRCCDKLRVASRRRHPAKIGAGASTDACNFSLGLDFCVGKNIVVVIVQVGVALIIGRA